MSVLVLGTVALDTLRTPFGSRQRTLGGSASHFSLAARLFTDVHLVAVIGEDFPTKYIKLLKDKGINLDCLARAKGKTFHWQGEYKGDLNSALTLKTELGVLATFKPQLLPAQKKIRYVFLANVDPDIQRYLLESLYSPQLVGLDSMNYWIHHQRNRLLAVLKKVNLYVANDQEARDLSGETNLIKAAQYLRCLGPQMILIKKGEHGALFYSGKYLFALPAYPTDKVIDPTGAGDTFAGGFIGYLALARKLDGGSIKKAIAYGTIAASFNVEGFGHERTQGLTRRDLKTRLAQFSKHTKF
jgi:sugar/nucleoside kinase (ribokinase family)